MNIAVLSGKGGAGKTLVAVNLAAVAGEASYVDCDVEAPNGRLFLQPQNVREVPAEVPFPSFDETRCVGCRKCVSFCRFHALAYVKGRLKVFPELCHACGGCAQACPTGAISEIKRRVGAVSVGNYGPARVVTGVLDEGEASAVPVIRAALRAGVLELYREARVFSTATLRMGRGNSGKLVTAVKTALHGAAPQTDLAILDGAPGIGCPVIASIGGADLALIVTEPSRSGLSDLVRLINTAAILQAPVAVCVNKYDISLDNTERIEALCAERGIPVVGHKEGRHKEGRQKEESHGDQSLDGKHGL